MLAAAGNYQAHVVEGGLPPVNKAGTVPKLFLKPATTVIADGSPLALTDVSSSIDWELELAIVIGTLGRDIPEDRALDYVAGYTVINDISARKMDWDIAELQPRPVRGLLRLAGRQVDRRLRADGTVDRHGRRDPRPR